MIVNVTMTVTVTVTVTVTMTMTVTVTMALSMKVTVTVCWLPGLGAAQFTRQVDKWDKYRATPGEVGLVVHN